MNDKEYMQQALTLAAQGLGDVEPNPAVGCVIVKDKHIIGQGYHQSFGGSHAEINALQDCRQKGNDPTGSTIYVTLEPCCFTGKTGPCTQALIQSKIVKVCAATEDPSEQVSGKGLQQLQQAGIETETGLCREEVESLNAPYFKHTRTGRSWVILKWAQSIDGKMAWRNPPKEGSWISNDSSRLDVHRTRKKVQGILTGIHTILEDNPRLTVRLEGVEVQRPPVRIVLDSQLRIPWDCRVLTTPDAPTWIVTTHSAMQTEQEKIFKLKQAGIEILEVGEKNQRCDLRETIRQLGQRGLQQILVEAGPTLQSHFLELGLADEVRIYIAPLLLGQSGIADISSALTGFSQIPMHYVQVKSFGDNALFSARL